jgi:hypothetical protein
MNVLCSDISTMFMVLIVSPEVRMSRIYNEAYKNGCLMALVLERTFIPNIYLSTNRRRGKVLGHRRIHPRF